MVRRGVPGDWTTCRRVNDGSASKSSGTRPCSSLRTKCKPGSTYIACPRIQRRSDAIHDPGVAGASGSRGGLLASPCGHAPRSPAVGAWFCRMSVGRTVWGGPYGGGPYGADRMAIRRWRSCEVDAGGRGACLGCSPHARPSCRRSVSRTVDEKLLATVREADGWRKDLSPEPIPSAVRTFGGMGAGTVRPTDIRRGAGSGKGACAGGKWREAADVGPCAARRWTRATVRPCPHGRLDDPGLLVFEEHPVMPGAEGDAIPVVDHASSVATWTASSTGRSRGNSETSQQAAW